MSIPPIHDIVLGTQPGESFPFFASDGRLFLLSPHRCFSLWALLVYRWPEVLAALVGIVLLLLVFAILRVRRRPRDPCIPYCRRCNYDLRGRELTSPCPECGADLCKHSPVTGRSAIHRLRFHLLITGVALAGYAVMFIAHVPRVSRAMELFRWDAPAIARWAHANKAQWLERFDLPERGLDELDPQSGKVIRHVCDWPLSSAILPNVSPDAKLIVTTLGGGQLAAISLSTGKVIQSLERPDGGIGPGSEIASACWRHIAGWLDSRNVFVQFFDSKAKTNRVYRWNIDSGQAVPLADLHVATKAGRVAARMLYLIPNSNGPLAMEIPDPSAERQSYGSRSTVNILDLSRGGKIVRSLRDTYWRGCAPQYAANGLSFYIRGYGPFDIKHSSTADGKVLNQMKAPGFMGTLQQGPAGLAYYDATQRLFVATTNPDAITLFDEAKHEQVGQLTFDTEDPLPHDEIAISPDGRWVAICVTQTARAGVQLGANQYVEHLLVFDLNRLESATQDSGADE